MKLRNTLKTYLVAGTAVVAVVASVSLFWAVGCSSEKSSTKATSSADASLPSGMTVGESVVGEGPNQVLFEANGSGVAEVAIVVATYQSQESGVSLPWKKTVRTSASPIVASIMVVGKEQGASCKLTINGKLVQEVKADPGQTMASCQTP